MIIASKWKLERKVGSGAFGEIYKGIHVSTNEEVAVKLEPAKTKFPQLYYEAKLYKIYNGAGKFYFYKIFMFFYSRSAKDILLRVARRLQRSCN